MRTIDADKLKKVLSDKDYITYTHEFGDAIPVDWIMSAIDNAPTVEERPTGEWIKHIDDLYPEDSTEECPFCHEEQRLVGNDDNFCPNCGADMRKEVENERYSF